MFQNNITAENDVNLLCIFENLLVYHWVNWEMKSEFVYVCDPSQRAPIVSIQTVLLSGRLVGTGPF